MVGRPWQPHVRSQSTAFVTTKVTRSSEWQVFTTEWLAKTAKPIGRRSAFCHNPAAMNPHWAIYKKEMRHYLRHFALAPLVALIPYLLNLAHWRQHGGLLRGLLYTLLAGTVIGFVLSSGLADCLADGSKLVDPPADCKPRCVRFGTLRTLGFYSSGRSAGYSPGSSPGSSPGLPDTPASSRT